MSLISATLTMAAMQAGAAFPFSLATDHDRTAAQFLEFDGVTSTCYTISGDTASPSFSRPGYPAAYGALSKSQSYLSSGSTGGPSGTKRGSIPTPFAMFTGSYLFYRDLIYLTSGEVFQVPKPYVLVSCDPAPTNKGFALLLRNEVTKAHSVSIFDGQHSIGLGSQLPAGQDYFGLCWESGSFYVFGMDETSVTVQRMSSLGGPLAPCFSQKLEGRRRLSGSASTRELSAVRSLMTIVNKGRDMYYVLGDRIWHRKLNAGASDWSKARPVAVKIRRPEPPED